MAEDFYMHVEFPKADVRRTKAEPSLEWAQNPKWSANKYLKRADIEGDKDVASLPFFQAIIEQGKKDKMTEDPPCVSSEDGHRWYPSSEEFVTGTRQGFIFVHHLPILAFGNLLFIHSLTNPTDDHKYSPFPPQTLPNSGVWVS